MANSIKVLFWVHRSKINKEGKAPLILRLTYLSQRTEKATGYYVVPEQWNPVKQKVKGRSQEDNSVNEFIQNTTTRATKLFNEATEANDVSLNVLIVALFSKPKSEPMLMKTIDLFVSDLKDRVGKDYRYSTYEKYVFMQEKVASFLKQQKIKDVRLKDLKTSFIIDFDHFLRTSENNQHNTAVKYCINLKRVINVAVLRGLIPSSPLNAYKTVYKDTQQIYLNEAELITLQYVALKKQTHKICLDLFLFQCFTGMAYTDMINLENKDISFDDGRKWIIKPRQKSNIVATIPLLHDAYTIIEKYHEYEKKGKFLLPRYSIQKYNQYIGEIGKIAGISKKLSSHAGRRTFGNIALARGVSLNVISKILGHANTLITQRIYAITTQKIISNEIDKLELKE